MLSAGEPSTCHLLLGLEQVCLCHGICELFAVAQPVAELKEYTLRLWRTELSLGDLLVGWLGCAACTPHVQAMATSVWALL